MKPNHAALALFCAVALSASLALAVAQTTPADIVKTKCTRCHDMTRICVMIGKRDAAGWQATATRMIGNGAKLAEGDPAAIAAFLAGPEAAADLNCPK